MSEQDEYIEAVGEAGETVYFDPETGQPLIGYDVDGEAFDASGYALAEPEDPVTQANQRMDEIEARLDAQPPVQFLPEPALDGDAIVEGWRTDEADIERSFGYTLTNAQRRAIATHAADMGMGLIDAAEDLAARDRGVLADLDDPNLTSHQRHEARTAQWAERLQDASGESGDRITGQREPRQPEYNTDRHEDRVAQSLDVLEGRISREDAARASWAASDYEP